MSEDKVPKIMFETKRKKVTEGSIKLHYAKFHNLFPSPNIFWVIKSRSMSRTVHIGKGTQNFGWKRSQQRPSVRSRCRANIIIK
jgi:hypothetical protein